MVTFFSLSLVKVQLRLSKVNIKIMRFIGSVESLGVPFGCLKLGGNYE